MPTEDVLARYRFTGCRAAKIGTRRLCRNAVEQARRLPSGVASADRKGDIGQEAAKYVLATFKAIVARNVGVCYLPLHNAPDHSLASAICAVQ